MIFLFLFLKKFLLPSVHHWYFTLSLVPKAPECGWSKRGPHGGGPCVLLGWEEGTSMEGGVWICLNHSELHCSVWASVSLLGPWEGPGEIQSNMVPKTSGDHDLALSQGTSFQTPPSTIPTPCLPPKRLLLFC